MINLNLENLNYVIPAIVIGLVQLCKNVGMPEKYAPFASIALAVLFESVFLYRSDIKQGVLMGIIIGLSSSGLYSGVKSLGK